jgi:hypothetical protein
MLGGMADVLRILDAAVGDLKAVADLLTLVSDELRNLAAAHLADEWPGQTLQATALVHNAYLPLVGPGSPRGGSVGTASSPPPPKPCAASGSKLPGGSRPSSTAAGGSGSPSMGSRASSGRRTARGWEARSLAKNGLGRDALVPVAATLGPALASGWRPEPTVSGDRPAWSRHRD